MKLKKLLFAALLPVLAVACQQAEIETLSNIKVDGTYLAIGVDGGSATLNLTTTDAWSVDAASVPEWLTIVPMSGAAGESTVTFSAAGTEVTNNAEVRIICGGQTQYINVIQYATPAEPVLLTVKEALALIKKVDKGDGQSYNVDGTYYVTGKVCQIDEISLQYGNATYYLSDDGTKGGDVLQVYRGFWLDGAKFTKGDELAIGDELTILTSLMSYKGTPETVQNTAKVVSVKKSLISVTPDVFDVTKDEGVVVAKVVYKGDNFDFSIDSDWLAVTDVKKVKDTTEVSIRYAANESDARTGVITMSSTGEVGTSQVTVTIRQAAGFAAFPLPYDETFLAGDGSWVATDVVPVEGVASIWVNDSKYGMKATSTKAVASQADLVSPLIDLSGVSSAVLSFEHVQRFCGNPSAELKLFVSTDNGETWTEVLIPNYSPGNNWTYVPSGEISLKPFAGKLVNIKFQYKSTEKNYGTWEIKNLKIVEGVAKIENVASLIDGTVTNETEWSGTFTDAVVTYVNGNNAFIEDATGGIQLYKKDHGLTAGQVISGEVSGKVKLYNGFAELTDLDVSKATVTAGDVPAPTVLTLASLLDSYLRYQNCQVKLEGVTFDAAITKSNRNGVISQNGATVAAYAQVKNTLEMSGTGDLVCWPTRYNANLQVGVWDNSHFTVK